MEHYTYNGKEIIGIDHGFGNIKCRHVVFRSGVRAYDTEPAMTADALYYDGKYYVVGEEHKGFVSDKSQDEDYYILTVAALARELEFRHITECEAVLAVGLPIQWIGAQKEAFRKYLMRNEMIEFQYHGQDYLVRIDDVQVFPQGFAGVVQRLGDFKGLNILADIGNGTMNTMLIKDGKPMSSRCYTDKLGVEQCIIRMSNELLAVSGFAMPYDVCEDFLRKGNAQRQCGTRGEIYLGHAQGCRGVFRHDPCQAPGIRIQPGDHAPHCHGRRSLHPQTLLERQQ